MKAKPPNKEAKDKAGLLSKAEKNRDEVSNVSELVDSLVSLADHILNLDEVDVALLEQYTGQLAKLDLKQPESGRNKAKIKKLSELHSILTQRVEEEKQDVRKKLVSLKKGGKVVLRYTDHLPKSISLRPKRKL